MCCGEFWERVMGSRNYATCSKPFIKVIACFILPKQDNKKAPQEFSCGACIIAGAASRTRTGDPILTMDVLYLLS